MSFIRVFCLHSAETTGPLFALMAFADTKDGPGNKGHKKLPRPRRAGRCRQGPGNGRAAVSILEEPAGRGELDVEPEGKKVALSSFQVSVAQKCFHGVSSNRPVPLLSAHLGLLLPRTEHRSLFPLYGRSFLRHLKLSTIVYRANYFIFIVNLSVEEPISKIRLE